MLVRRDVRVVSIEEINEERLYFEYNHEDLMKMLQQLKNKLTKREAEVLDLMLEGKKLSEIAKMLGVSKPRITTIKHHIMEKLKIEFGINFLGNFFIFRKEVKNETSDINFIYEETFDLCVKLLDTIGTYKKGARFCHR